MLVEFTGPTGAGKSRLLSELLETHLANEMWLTNHERYFNFSSVRNPTQQNLALDRRAIGMLVREMSILGEASFCHGLLSARSFRWFDRINAGRSYLRKRGMHSYCRRYHRDDLVLMDEGIVHGVHNLFVNGIEPPKMEEVDAYLNHVPLPDKIILVTARPEVLKQRIIAREDKPLRTTNAARLERFAADAAILFKLLRAHPVISDRLVVVDNSAPSGLDSTMASVIIKEIQKCST